MFTKALYSDTLRGLIGISKIPFLNQCYLAGGTALAFHLDHRISVDLDFFTDQKFNEQEIAGKLAKLPDFKLDETPPRTILGKIGETRFSLFYYPFRKESKTLSVSYKLISFERMGIPFSTID